MTTKQSVVIYANCQGSVIGQILEKHYSNLFCVKLLTNYQFISNKLVLPVELISSADVFIYQPIHGHGVYDTDFIVNEYIDREKTKCISFPYIYFLGYHPDHFEDTKYKTLSQNPNSLILKYGHKWLSNHQNENPEKCLDHHETLFDVCYMNGKRDEALVILGEREKQCTIKVSGLIRDHYKQKLLFNTVNHPSNELYYLLFELFRQELKLELKDIQQEREFQNEHVDMIYPQVHKHHQFEFALPKPVVNKKTLSMEEYVQLYCSLKIEE